MAVVADQKLMIENKIDNLNKQVEQLDREDGTGIVFTAFVCMCSVNTAV